MSRVGDIPPVRSQLRDDLITSVSTIYGRADFLTRAIRRSPSLTDDERTRMLEGLAMIEVAVRNLITLIHAIDALEREGGDGVTSPRGGRTKGVN